MTNPPVGQGKKYELEINGFGHSGEGVGRYHGFTSADRRQAAVLVKLAPQE